MQSPFTKALEYIRQAPEDGDATALAKLILSLYSDRYAFSVRECLGSLAPPRHRLAHQMLESFSNDAHQLEEAGKSVALLYPALCDIGCAMSTARLIRQRRHRDSQGTAAAA